MNGRGGIPADGTKTGLAVLGLGLLAGIAADNLLRVDDPGINVLLWTAVLLLEAVALVRFGGVAVAGEGRWLAVPLLLLAAGFAWRASFALHFLDFVLFVLTLGLAVLRSRTGRLRRAGVADYVLGVVAGWLHIFVGSGILLFSEISWSNAPGRRWLATASAVLRGALIALPLVLVFGGLFVMADAMFEQWIAELFDFTLTRMFDRLLFTLFAAWIAAGILRSLLRAVAFDPAVVERAVKPVKLGMIEIGTVLGALNLLFLSFVFVQFRYFFGGDAVVQAATGLTYAEYARRGFFELAAVAVLLIPALLLAHWLLPKEHPAHERLFRLMAGPLTGMLFLVMASAAYRMWLYQSHYGLTELRLYVSVFMAWLAGVLFWFVMTVLRGRRDRFVFGALVAGYLVVALLHAVNPDALIARVNLARSESAERLDADYVSSLGADAVPVLIRALPDLPAAMQGPIADRILQRFGEPEMPDWRSWNWGRAAAWEAVRVNRALLEDAATAPRPDEGPPEP